MKKFLSLFLLIVLICVIPVNATNADSQKKLLICESPDYPPSLFGDLNYILRCNFKYPADAWKAQKLYGVDVQLLIDNKGRVRDVESEMDLHPSLMKEIKRVIQKTRWYPAKYKGTPVNVKCHRLLNLSSSVFPYGLDKQVNDANRIIKLWNKTTSLSDIKDDDVNRVEQIVMMFPDNAQICMKYAGYLNAAGRYDKAMFIMDSTFNVYHSLYRPLDSFPSFVTDLRNERSGYNGRSEIAVALTRAMTHDLGNSELRDSAFEETLKLIDARIVDGDLLENVSEKELKESKARTDQLRRSMISEFTDGKLQLSRSDELWQRLVNGYSIDQVSDYLEYWSKKGVVNDAMIIQLTNLLDEERKTLLTGSKLKNGTINLFGVKALALWLYKGDTALDSYLAQIEAGSDNEKVKQYIAGICRDFRKNRETLNDPKDAIRSLSCLLPDKNNSSEVDNLKTYRKTLGNVFPLKWLYRE